MMYEIYKQLQGKAGPRQVKDAKIGLAHAMGGTPLEGATAAIILLGRKD
jgi:acetyl-CoA C-acetyltransferase